MPYTKPQLRTVNVDRYILPLREGGSMPGLVEADDGFKYVVKFHGAGQGPKVLISELIGGELARALGFKVPEIVFVTLDKSFGRIEQDEEIQDQLKASAGLNIGLSYLSGSITFDPNVTVVSPEIASRIVWLDCLITNPDRTARNPNMLTWYKELWLIDHGAALYFHYNWNKPPAQLALKPFERVKNHLLLQQATLPDEANQFCSNIIRAEFIHDLNSLIPDEWLVADNPFDSTREHRKAYEEYLLARLQNSMNFVNEAKHAGETNI